MKSIVPLIVALAMAAPAFGQGAKVSSPVELTRQADRLKPGEWVWAPEIAPKGSILVYVDLSKQVATIYRNGVRIGVTTVSTGKAGHETPTGVFAVLQKDADHHSNKYNNASMPFTQRLTWDGIALHAGGLPGYPESHGCVHLPYSFARALFETTATGATVIIAGNAQHPVSTGGGQVLTPGTGTSGGQAGVGDYWAPEKSAVGPLTIIISRVSQQAVVLRNGVEIGRSHVTIPQDNETTHVLTLSAEGKGGQTWIYAGVSGHGAEAGKPLDEARRNRVQVPEGFLKSVSAVLVPGTTLLVTNAVIDDAGTPPRLTVLSGATTTE